MENIEQDMTLPEDLSEAPVLSDEELPGAIEAILFSLGGSVEPERIAAALGRGRGEIIRVIRELQRSYEEDRRGVRIQEFEGNYQMCSAREYYSSLIRIAKIPKKITLTDVLLETLSIIAYKQPVTKLEIEQIRGVKSDHAVNRLVEYGLVGEIGRLEAPGRPILFGTTEEFLRHFGLSSVEELPEVDPLRREDFKMEAEQEIDVKLKV